MDEIRKIPPVTRFIVGSTLAVTLPLMLQVLPGDLIIFDLSKLKQLQVWRLITCFFYGGNGLQFLFDIIMLYRNSDALESTYYNRRSPEYAYQLVLASIGILLLNLPLETIIHYRALLVCITYLASRLSPNAPVSVFGILSLKALYFPFVLVGLDLITGGPPAAAVSLTGVIAGHAWWLLEWKEDGPSHGGGGRGGVMGRAPRWLVNLVGMGEDPQTRDAQQNQRAYGGAYAPRGRGLNDGGSGATGNQHTWGSGQRLGGT
ncbi:hypothetical protein FRC03_010437 [Tulasnella sp. 419]|nr:hypothetical protein FRC03_010437 [Tulasnella sp. 419]